MTETSFYLIINIKSIDNKIGSSFNDIFNDRISSQNKTAINVTRKMSSIITYKSKDCDNKSKQNTVTLQHRISLLKEDIEEKELEWL